MTYEGLRNATDSENPHLGGNILGGDPLTFAPRAWNYLIDRFAIESVLDLGSGCGNAAAYFHRKALKVIAVDGLMENVESAVFPTLRHDLCIGPVCTRVDLVHCQEVVEHVEERFVENVLESLTNGKFIVMTHAVPGQGGWHHVNCQPEAYWIQHLERYGCSLLREDTNRIRALALEDGARYLSETGLVFSNNARINQR